MKILKVGDRKNMGSRTRYGFTLLELLMVIALIGVLSFSVVYGFKEKAIDPLKRGEDIILKLLKIGRRIAILEDGSVNIMVHKYDRRLICLKTENSSMYELLPEGVDVYMEACKQMTVEGELWDFIEIDNSKHRSCGMSLVLSEDKTKRVNFDFD